MTKLSKKDLLSALFELTHTKNEKEEYVPNFCFASDISVDDDRTEEEIAVIALKNDYKVYKVFPGETMLGGLLIVAEGATTEPVENMYKEFYGEVPEIAEMKLDDDDNLVEVEEVKEDLQAVDEPKAKKIRVPIKLQELGWSVNSSDCYELDDALSSEALDYIYDSYRDTYKIDDYVSSGNNLYLIVHHPQLGTTYSSIAFSGGTLISDVPQEFIDKVVSSAEEEVDEDFDLHPDMPSIAPKEWGDTIDISAEDFEKIEEYFNNLEVDDNIRKAIAKNGFNKFVLPLKDKIMSGKYIVFIGRIGSSRMISVAAPDEKSGVVKNILNAYANITVVYDDILSLIHKHPLTEFVKEDLDLVALPGITDKDRYGDIEAFKNEYKKKAQELGATITFKTKVGPKRLDSFWYKDKFIAVIKYKDYTIDVFGDGSDAWVALDDGDGPLTPEEMEELGYYNDETFPRDYEDGSFPGIEFSIRKGRGEKYYSADLNYDTLWDLESALDIEDYINNTIPEFEESFDSEEDESLTEAKNKRPKLTVRDPNAAAMWGRTRHRVELPKKGKGSFKRHPKHRVDEAFYTPEPEDVERFTNLLKENGWTIESVKEDDSRYDEANNVHIQLIDTKTFPVEVPENATDQTKYEAHRKYCVDEGHADEVWSRADEVENIINQFDPDRKYHITYSASFGGTSHTGVDCTGKVTVGMDMRPYFVDDDFAHTEMIGEGKKKRKTKNPLKAAAERHQKSNNKKHAMGWFIVPNVEKSIQAFNHANNAPGAESTITAPAGLGEDLDLSTADNYAWDFDSANKYLTMNYRFDDATGRYTNDTYYFARIPETALKVSRDDYKTHKLLKRRKNRHVLAGVEKFFNEHPKSKYCIISCRDISRSEPGRFVNAYRVLDEDLDLVPATYTKDGFTREHSYDNGSSFYMDGIQAEAFIDELVPYLTQDLQRRKEQGYMLPFDEYDISVAKSYNKTREDDRGFITLEKDDMFVYVALTPDIWLDASCDFAIPIKDFEEVFKNIVDIDRIPISVPAKELTPEEVEEIKAALNVAKPVNESVCKVLEKVEKHDTLNQLLWDENNKLKPEVRETILQIVKDFTDGLEQDGIKFKIKDIVLVGSNCSYNYTDKSDLDIHIRMDTDSLECPDNLYPLLYGAYRALYNNKMDIDFYGIPVEIYVETDDTQQLNEPVDNQE